MNSESVSVRKASREKDWLLAFVFIPWNKSTVVVTLILPIR